MYVDLINIPQPTRNKYKIAKESIEENIVRPSQTCQTQQWIVKIRKKLPYKKTQYDRLKFCMQQNI